MAKQEIIDDQGRLFGSINVVDALVVLLVSAVLLAGFVLVFGGGGGGGETDATNVTIDLGTQPEFIVQEINIGDTAVNSPNSNLTITDVYVTTGDGSDPHVIVRAELIGTATDSRFEYAGAPVRLGRSISVNTTDYAVNGRIRAKGSGTAIERQNPTVVVEDTVNIEDVRALSPGDEIRVVGRTVATVNDLAIYATNDPETRRVYVETSLNAYHQGGNLRFGGQQVRRGQNIRLSGDAYTIDGSIERVGNLQQGTPTTRNITLRMGKVRQEYASSIEQGMVERTSDQRIAEITDVNTEPTTVVVTGDEGSFNTYDHPYLRDVLITAEVQVRETPAGVYFKGELIRPQGKITFNLDTTTVRGTIIQIR